MKFNKGQSIFEVIAAIGLISLIMIVIVAMAGLSVKNNSYSRNNTLATRSSEETLEWLKEQKDTNWTDFSEHAVNQKWCFPTLSFVDGKVGPCGSEDFIQGTEIKREVNFSTIDTSNIQTITTIYWTDTGGYHEVSSVTDLTNWQAK